MKVRLTRLARLRAERELTQAELALRAGLEVSTIARLENGQSRNPHAQTLTRIARALGVEVDDLSDEDAA